MGLVVGENHHGRWLLRDRQGRFRAQVAAHVALPKHRHGLHLFAGSVPERNKVRLGLLTENVPVRDTCRSNTACK